MCRLMLLRGQHICQKKNMISTPRTVSICWLIYGYSLSLLYKTNLLATALKEILKSPVFKSCFIFGSGSVPRILPKKI